MPADRAESARAVFAKLGGNEGVSLQTLKGRFDDSKLQSVQLSHFGKLYNYRKEMLDYFSETVQFIKKVIKKGRNTVEMADFLGLYSILSAA